MKKILVSLLLCSCILSALSGCAFKEKESSASLSAQETGEGLADFEDTDWKAVSIEPEDYGITDDMLKSLTDEEFSRYPLDKLVAFYLHTDGAAGESSGDELYRRFLEAPNTVLTYIALIGDQEVPMGGAGEVPANQVLCQDIAGADAAWYGTTEKFSAILERYERIYPTGRIAELLTCLREERETAIRQNS